MSACNWLTGWLNAWLYITDWVIDWLSNLQYQDTDWLNNLLTGWLCNWVRNWLTEWMIEQLTEWLTDCKQLTDWPRDWLGSAKQGHFNKAFTSVIYKCIRYFRVCVYHALNKWTSLLIPMSFILLLSCTEFYDNKN